MGSLLMVIMLFFWILLMYYSIVMIGGLWYRIRYESPGKLNHYPSTAVFIPTHNEGVVIEQTLSAMGRLQYTGQLDIYLLDDQSKDYCSHCTEFCCTFFAYSLYSGAGWGTKGEITSAELWS